MSPPHASRPPGLRAFGITLAMWPGSRETVRDRGCCSIDAVDDARRVATALALPHYVWNLERDFEAEVVTRLRGRAMRRASRRIPCVRCNQRIKFGVLLERARAAGATHLATGHYARTGRRGAAGDAAPGSRPHAATRRTCSTGSISTSCRRAVFALGGDESKADVRAEAAALGLGTAAKPESQDLCFVDADLKSELRARLAGRFAPGAITDIDGTVAR